MIVEYHVFISFKLLKYSQLIVYDPSQLSSCTHVYMYVRTYGICLPTCQLGSTPVDPIHFPPNLFLLPPKPCAVFLHLRRLFGTICLAVVWKLLTHIRQQCSSLPSSIFQLLRTLPNKNWINWSGNVCQSTLVVVL